jgi:hypothetical protein
MPGVSAISGLQYITRKGLELDSEDSGRIIGCSEAIV